MKDIKKRNILNNFKHSTCGILTCVYCLSEGWDLPLLDSVVFAENMESSIRIIQAMLRPCRLYSNNPRKLAKIIIPTTDENWLTNPDSDDNKKIRQIIYSLSDEDEKISNKIIVAKSSIIMDKETYGPNMTSFVLSLDFQDNVTF